MKNEAKFKERKSRFFGLMFTDGNIVVRMLESVREHVLEGKAMHHCVGSGTNYSLNPDCIIFSARIAEQRVETVEFSLEQMKVVQCHGLQNKDTEHHADIINLVNSNARLIEQRMVATTCNPYRRSDENSFRHFHEPRSGKESGKETAFSLSAMLAKNKGQPPIKRTVLYS